MRVFVVVFLIVVIVSTAVTFILPEIYASTATVKLDDEAAAIQYTDGGQMPTTFEIIKSQLVLTNVITALNLKEVWGKKYNGGNPLKTAETMKILQQRMVLAPVGNTKMISITVYSEDSKEAAQIANQVARAYHDFRIQGIKDDQIDDLKILEAELAAQSNQLQAATSTSEIQNMRARYEVLLSKVTMARIDTQLPVYEIVQITDPAEPAKVPIRPNKPLNITIGVVGGILLASIIGALVLATKAIARRKAGASAV
jgi:uncharacterized protein involved in exopolysaccharide biosynthesis